MFTDVIVTVEWKDQSPVTIKARPNDQKSGITNTPKAIGDLAAPRKHSTKTPAPPSSRLRFYHFNSCYKSFLKNPNTRIRACLPHCLSLNVYSPSYVQLHPCRCHSRHKLSLLCQFIIIFIFTWVSTLTVTNCGDSRAVLCSEGTAVKLTQRHRPSHLDKRARVEKARGFVSYDSRQLSMSSRTPPKHM